jgi:hyaluronoglucosaminidase
MKRLPTACLLIFLAVPAWADVPLRPAPRKVVLQGGEFRLGSKVQLVGAEEADPAALALLKQGLGKLGPEGEVTQIVIGERGDAAMGAFLKDVPEKSGAYRIAVREGKLVVAGHDGRGTYYGIRSLGQILDAAAKPGSLPALEITDWPEVPHRGVVEGFYGTPWSHEKRLSLIRFMGERKLDTYIYGPKDDPFHSSPDWRKPYPAAEGARIRELAEFSRSHHVDFVWAVHPGKDIKWNDEDFQNVLGKFEAMYALGVRSFAVFFDDISGEGTKADQQARLLNFLQREFVEKKHDVTPLVMCPTQYNKSWSSGDYLDILGQQLHPSIHVMWTGDRVIADMDRAAMEWINGRIKREAYIWWNFPVSDYVRNHLLMGPAYGNAPDIGGLYGGFVSNPMERPEASKVALSGVADYAWNPAEYDAQASWKAGIRAILPGAAEAFECFCSHNSDLGPNGHGYRRKESVDFAPVAEAFLSAFREGKPADTSAVRAELARIAAAPGAIRKAPDNPALIEEISPWLDAFAELGKAGVAGLDAAKALDAGQEQEAWSRLSQANAALAAMAEIDRRENRNPHQPGIRTATLIVTPLVREVVETTGGRLLAKLSGKPMLRLSGISASADRDSLPLMLDGKEDTFYYCREIQKAGDWFGVDLGGLQEVRRIRIVQGRNDGDHDRVHTGVLEGHDGHAWKELAKCEGARIDLTLDRPVTLRQIRMRVIKPGKADGSKNDVWTAIREFEVNPSDAAALRTNVEGLAAQPVRFAEGEFAVSPAFEVQSFGPGKYLGLLFPQAAVVKKIGIDLKTPDPGASFTLEGSANGKDWRKIEAKVEGTKLLAEPGEPFRALRVRNHGRETREVTLGGFKVAIESKVDPFAAMSDGDLGTVTELAGAESGMVALTAPAPAVILLLGQDGEVTLSAETPSGRQALGKVRGPFVRVKLPAQTRALVVGAQGGKVGVYEVVPVNQG